MPRLSERQRRFVEAYLSNGGNGLQAAIAAGYSRNGAEVQASRLLTNANVANALRERVERDPAIATRQERQQFWTDLMHDPRQKPLVRLKASALLGKSQGDFIQRVEHSGVGGQPIQVEAVRRLDRLSEAELAQLEQLTRKALVEPAP